MAAFRRSDWINWRASERMGQQNESVARIQAICLVAEHEYILMHLGYGNYPMEDCFVYNTTYED